MPFATTSYTKISSYLSNMGMGAWVVVLALTWYALYLYHKAEYEAAMERKAIKEAEDKERKEQREKEQREYQLAAEAHRQKLIEEADARRQELAAAQAAQLAEQRAARARAAAEAKQKRAERRTKIRAEMDPDLVSLLDELHLFDWMTHYDETVGEAFYRIGIKTLTILAGRNAGGGGGIQPQKLEKEYRVPAGVAVDLKQKAIARLQRPARSPARVRPAAANTA